MTKDLTKQREDECQPVAREILLVLGEISADCMIGQFNEEEGRLAYQKVVEEKIMPILHGHNIRTFDIAYILKMVMQPLDFIKQLTTDSLAVAEDLAVASKFGVKYQSDIRISDVIKAQMEAIDKNNKPVDNEAGTVVVNPADLA